MRGGLIALEGIAVALRAWLALAEPVVEGQD